MKLFQPLVTALVLGIAATTLARQPNIVLILADDLGPGDLGAYGQLHIKTPNLDRMAAEGMKLTQHYCGNAVCAPSRSVLMTGLHPGHTYIRDNRGTPSKADKKHGGIPETEGQHPIPDDAVTMAEAMRGMGYATGGFGKWGLGGPGSPGDPLKQGFQRWFGYNCQSVAHNFYPVYLWDNDKILHLKNPDFPAADKLKPEEGPDEAGELQALSRCGILGRSHRRAGTRLCAPAQGRAFLPLLAHHGAARGPAGAE